MQMNADERNRRVWRARGARQIDLREISAPEGCGLPGEATGFFLGRLPGYAQGLPDFVQRLGDGVCGDRRHTEIWRGVTGNGARVLVLSRGFSADRANFGDRR